MSGISKPIWKSEAEYRLLFDGELGKKKLDDLEFTFGMIEKYLNDNLAKPVINDYLIEYCEKELDNLNRVKGSLSEADFNSKSNGINNILKWANCLKISAFKMMLLLIL